MGTRFVALKIEEMQEFLEPQGFMPVEVSNCDEVVYGRRLKTHAPTTVRVYTSIPKGGTIRGVGQDAIRVNLWTKQDGNIVKVGTSKNRRRVNRTKNWRVNLQKLIDLMANVKDCNGCDDGILVPRNGTNGMFLGCTNYPDCNCSANLRAPKAAQSLPGMNHRQTLDAIMDFKSDPEYRDLPDSAVFDILNQHHYKG